MLDILDDCMIGAQVSTATGDGLNRKSDAIRQRSAYVIPEKKETRSVVDRPMSEQTKKALGHLKVKDGGAYVPREGGFVDLHKTFPIPYDSRFEKKGCLTEKSGEDMGRMWSWVLKQLESVKKAEGRE
jgi:hypothetical protein